ncbi:hypothetical protein QFC19_009354 [Naganishia cerealis]|uniref:Uncharacterized protein n=1 Tax=Naganishia cerealis TaxID=610337 RepID=A0ACC2UVQ1_9TREE|nr:hypothetical protein QFC19_009354 [Naganishia cerealis]
MPGDLHSLEDDPSANGLTFNRQNISIYDFNPAHVKKAKHLQGGGKTPFRLSETLNILDLHTPQGSPPGNDDHSTVLVTKSGPAVGASHFEHETENYATRAPYIATTKAIEVESSSSGFAGQLAHDLLLLTHLHTGAFPDDRYGEREQNQDANVYLL